MKDIENRKICEDMGKKLRIKKRLKIHKIEEK